jgi:hypothetical protein
VSPVGAKNLCSDALVLHEILAGLKEAGVPAKESSFIAATGRKSWKPASTGGATFTICLKNMSHGMMNNVNRSHTAPR